MTDEELLFHMERFDELETFSEELLYWILGFPASRFLYLVDVFVAFCDTVAHQVDVNPVKARLIAFNDSGFVEACWRVVDDPACEMAYSASVRALVRLGFLPGLRPALLRRGPMVLRALDVVGRRLFLDWLSAWPPTAEEQEAIALELNDEELFAFAKNFPGAAFVVAGSLDRARTSCWWRVVCALAEAGRCVRLLFEPRELLVELAELGERRSEALALMRFEAVILDRWEEAEVVEAARLMAEAAEGSWGERRAAFAAELALARALPEEHLRGLWKARGAQSGAAAANLVDCFETFDRERLNNVWRELVAIVAAARTLPHCAHSCEELEGMLRWLRSIDENF
jgi:hypothetical protein